MNVYRGGLLAFLLWLLAGTVYGASVRVPQIPLLNWEERSDWINVKTDVTPRAMGNGVVDDTAAIQAAFNAVQNGTTIYLPKGTYRVTSTLTMTGARVGVQIYGQGAATRLKWDGAVGGTLWQDDGVSTSRFTGLVLDGQGKASFGFNHYSFTRFETEVRYIHVAFVNFTDAAVIAQRNDGYATAEVSFENCLFDRCGYGVVMGGFNDYDYTFDGCYFTACNTAIQCTNGNFYVRNCYFAGSLTADISANPEHGCSVRRSISVGSKQFINYSNSVSPLTVQDCQVSGWTGTGGAISHWGAPLILFDNVFTNPPDGTPPVRLPKPTQRVILSNNRADGAPNVIQASAEALVYQVPPGQRGGAVSKGSLYRQFLKSVVPFPSRVFDAKRDFGAVGNGMVDDTTAVQAAINAARVYGRNAIAYLPTGKYVIKQTLSVTGSNYYVGGSGFYTQLVWKGADGGTMMTVHNPRNVTLEHIAIGNHDSGVMNNAIDVLQTGSGTQTFMTYDGVFVYGMYQKQPERKGLRLVGLQSGDTVLIRFLQGNIRATNCAQATILGNQTYEGSILIDGNDVKRTGFTGFLTRLTTISSIAVKVSNNYNLVMSDFYIEQADYGFIFTGNTDEPAGRITIQGAKTQFDLAAGVMMNIDNYKGLICMGHDQFYRIPTEVRITHTGSRPLHLVLLNNAFYQTTLNFTSDGAGSLFNVGNDTIPATTPNPSIADNYTAETLAEIALAFDDLRRLGDVDLKLNHTSAILTMR